jgi:hypothetical protein
MVGGVGKPHLLRPAFSLIAHQHPNHTLFATRCGFPRHDFTGWSSTLPVLITCCSISLSLSPPHIPRLVTFSKATHINDGTIYSIETTQSQPSHIACLTASAQYSTAFITSLITSAPLLTISSTSYAECVFSEVVSLARRCTVRLVQLNWEVHVQQWTKPLDLPCNIETLTECLLNSWRSRFPLSCRLTIHPQRYV